MEKLSFWDYRQSNYFHWIRIFDWFSKWFFFLLVKPFVSWSGPLRSCLAAGKTPWRRNVGFKSRTCSAIGCFHGNTHASHNAAFLIIHFILSSLDYNHPFLNKISLNNEIINIKLILPNNKNFNEWMSLKLNDKKMKTKWKKNVTFFSQLIKCKFSLAHGPQR